MPIQEQVIDIHMFLGRFVSGFHIEPDAVSRCVGDEAVVQQAPSTMFDSIQGEVELLQQPDKCDDAFFHGKLVANALSGANTKRDIGIWMPRRWPLWTLKKPLWLELLFTQPDQTDEA